DRLGAVAELGEYFRNEGVAAARVSRADVAEQTCGFHRAGRRFFVLSELRVGAGLFEAEDGLLEAIAALGDERIAGLEQLERLDRMPLLELHVGEQLVRLRRVRGVFRQLERLEGAPRVPSRRLGVALRSVQSRLRPPNAGAHDRIV